MHMSSYLVCFADVFKIMLQRNWLGLIVCNVISRFHKLVKRCYCPSEEVAKRAIKAGLKPSQIKVYGLPVRPSFVKPITSKVCNFFWDFQCLSYFLEQLAAKFVGFEIHVISCCTK